MKFKLFIILAIVLMFVSMRSDSSVSGPSNIPNQHQAVPTFGEGIKNYECLHDGTRYAFVTQSFGACPGYNSEFYNWYMDSGFSHNYVRPLVYVPGLGMRPLHDQPGSPFCEETRKKFDLWI